MPRKREKVETTSTTILNNYPFCRKGATRQWPARGSRPMVPTPVILANCTAEREVISRHKLIVCLSHVAGDGNELHSSQTDAFFRLPT